MNTALMVSETHRRRLLLDDGLLPNLLLLLLLIQFQSHSFLFPRLFLLQFQFLPQS